MTIELKRNVAESVTSALEPLKNRIDSQIGQKLSNSDQIVRDGVMKMVSSHGFQESISRVVAASLQPSITESYKEVKRIF